MSPPARLHRRIGQILGWRPETLRDREGDARALQLPTGSPEDDALGGALEIPAQHLQHAARRAVVSAWAAYPAPPHHTPASAPLVRSAAQACEPLRRSRAWT